MTESEFWACVDWAFGSGRGRSLASDLVLASLDGRSPADAVERGGDPLRAWFAICEAMDLPGEYRYLHRIKPDDRPVR